MNAVSSFNNSTNKHKEMILCFKDKNHKFRKNKNDKEL